MRFLFIRLAMLATISCFFGPLLAQSDSVSRLQPPAVDTVVSRSVPVRGRVGENVNGKRIPLVGASVRWAGTGLGTVTDSAGRFLLMGHPTSKKLIVSYITYQSDTTTVMDPAAGDPAAGDPAAELTVTLRPDSPGTGRQLQEVTVSGSPGQIDRLNPIQTELITQRTLAKAACCNLSESFETNASVNVSYADAVTGARQIQFLGLGGQYVQINVENIPTVRGLATAFGLNYIPGTWITSIDVGKGAGSVVNGYESMSGQMNIELQKPDDIHKLLLNGYANSFGRLEGNANWSKALRRRWSVGVLGHVSTLQTEIDQNNDGFRDLPLYTQVNIINRYKYSGDRFMAQFGAKVLYEDRNGGQLSQIGPSRYRFGNTTKRLELFSKMARLFPDKPYKGIGLILNALNHDQTAIFGFRPYSGRQQTFYANLIYQNIIGNTNHAYKAGLSYLLDDYRELLGALATNRTESVPGVFAEYTYTYPEKLTLVLGGRFDYHNLFGPQWTPRAHLKYDLSPALTLRASAGRGFRVPNLLAENFGYFVSSRVIFNEAQLRPERSWNYGASLTHDFTLLGKKASLLLDYHRTDFQEQLFVDIEHPREIHFHNLYGKSFANSFQAELNYQPIRRLEIKAAYRLFDVRQSMSVPSEDTLLLPRMMIARHRLLLNVGYALPFDKWKFDATLQWNGPRRIPYLRTGAGADYATVPQEYAPGFYNLNAQLSRAFRSGWEVYLGGENLTGFRQTDPIIAASDPFGQNFDAGSRVWGPITGRMVYVGFRFKPVQ